MKIADFKSKTNAKSSDNDHIEVKIGKVEDNFKKYDEQECFIEDNILEENKEKENNIIEDNIDEEIKKCFIENSSEDDINEDNKTKAILKRHEKIIGKPKSKEIYAESPRFSIRKMTPLPEKRSKSMHSYYSTESRQEAYTKLQFLQNKENKIKKQKDELLKFLESRSQAKSSLRPATVASLYNNKETESNSPLNPGNNTSNLPEIINQQRQHFRTSQSKNSSTSTRNRRKRSIEIKDLINSLFDY